MAEALLEVLKYSIPALVVFLVTYFSLRQYLEKEYRLKELEYKMASIRNTQPVRLQAYERITLFLERISFSNLLHRVRQNNMNVREFQMALLSNIRQEYEHNMTQQVYVSTELWNMTRAAKEEVLSTINRTAATIPPEAPSLELSKRVFAFIIDAEHEQPTQRALNMLKREVMELY